jgi:hypothetical protein
MKIELVNGAVLKDGEQIGTYNAETNTVHCPQRISPALYGPIKEAIGKKPNYDFGAPNDPPARMVSGEKTNPTPGSPHETLAADATVAVKPEAKKLPDATEFTKAYPEPDQDPQFGDKTPAWARWLRDTNPEEFKRRFAGRKLTLD